MVTLDDAAHRSLDADVTRRCLADHDVPETLEDRDKKSLLCAIVTHSRGTLDRKYTDRPEVAKLLNTETELSALLDTAWSTKSYRAIRELPVLQAARPASPVEGPSQDNLYESFKAPYRGTAVDGFVAYLSQNNEAFGFQQVPMYYGKFCSIVQSSGTGKSRLMLELSKKGVVVLYMNLRPQADDSGFPPRDQIPADILTKDLQPDCGPVQYAARCCAFFSAVFLTLQQSLSTAMAAGVQDATNQWTANMCDVRSAERGKFFASLQGNYNTYLTKIGTPPSDDPVGKSTAQMGNLSLGDASGSKAPTMPGHPAMISAYKDMLFALKPLFGEEKSDAPKLVIALDEAHLLSEILSGYRPSIILCRAISLFSAVQRVHSPPVCVVFASTTSKVADFAAPRPHFDSARVTGDGQLLFPPYCQLGWDQHADPLRAIAATDVAKAHHIIGYGRALWKSQKNIQGAPLDMLTFAVSKLSGSAQENKALAVFAQRFCLNVAFGHREAASFVESSVASHLRVCITTTEDRNWTYTTYPSEPLLSCAAADLLHTNSAAFDQSLQVLQKKVNSGMIDVGKGGELVSRLLWLLAKDLLVRKIHPRTSVIPSSLSPVDQWESEFIDCKMISVHDYFQFLFGKNFWELAGSRAAAAFKDAYVNFSHWVSMDESICKPKREGQLLAQEWTLRHWHRTSAVQCCHNQPRIDKMIPIYFTVKPTESSGASHEPPIEADGESRGLLRDHSKDCDLVSQIFISDKARKASSRQTLSDITREDPSINCPSALPWVAILADMGLAGSEPLTVTYPEPNCETRSWGVVGPCLRIYAPAINITTFPFLEACPSLLATLKDIVSKEVIPSPSQKLIRALQAQVQYGTTPTEYHMKWEDS